MKVSLVVQVTTLIGVLVASSGYQQADKYNGDVHWALQNGNSHYGFNHPRDPFRLYKPERSEQWYQNSLSKPKWKDPMSKAFWQKTTSKPLWKDLKSKAGWRDPMSTPKWSITTPKPQWNTRWAGSNWQKPKKNGVSQIPDLCNNPPTFIAGVCIPCICNPNYNARQWPDYIPPIDFFKPRLDDPPAAN